jgi:hypothetical protein
MFDPPILKNIEMVTADIINEFHEIIRIKFPAE